MVNATEIVGFYPLWLILSGTIGNLISFCICYSLRKNTTFVFLMFITLADIATLYFWNIVSFLHAYDIMDLINYNLYSCRIGTFIQYSSLQSSAWLLVSPSWQPLLKIYNQNFVKTLSLSIFQVLLSLDRLSSLLRINWKRMLTPKRAIRVCFACVIAFIAFNFHILFLHGEQLNINGTMKTFCYSIGDKGTAFTATWNLVSCKQLRIVFQFQFYDNPIYPIQRSTLVCIHMCLSLCCF